MFRHRNTQRARRGRALGCELFESRCLLAVGPYVHTHNLDQLAVVDSSSGSIEILGRMSGFAEGDSRMSDIAFAPSGRLYGITRDWLYEIDPVTAELTNLGEHGIPNANSLAFERDGTLNAMGSTAPHLYEITFSDTAITRVAQRATLSGISSDAGANGDIAFLNNDLVVASSDNRLLFYRFDVNPDRPRVVRDIDLTALQVTNVFGLAAVTATHLYATTDDAVIHFDLTQANQVTIDEVSVLNTTFGDLRGAAYYAEAGGPVPVGTLSGIKWNDRNGDGIRQLNEPVLADWPVYLDLDLDGTRDTTEPLRRTDAEGRYYFFGMEPGFYTVDEIIENPSAWERTAPATSHRNLVGQYSFTTNQPRNELSHAFGLPNLRASGTNVGGGSAVLVSAASFLELPVALGDQPFTLAIDATYNAAIASLQYLVSQRSGTSNTDRDFDLTATVPAKAVAGTFCNQAGTCPAATQGTIDGLRHQFALTWDGERIGTFVDTTLTTQAVTGTRPDLDGELIRFGNPLAASPAAGLRGTIHEIRIFNAALSQTELQSAFSTSASPSAYSVWLDGEVGIDGLNFGNRAPVVVELIPEIEVRLNSVNGTLVVDAGDPLDLGRVVAGEPSPQQTLWIRNTGNATLSLSNISASTGFLLSGSPVTTLAPGESTSFQVSLSDVTTPGIRSGEIVIANNDADENPFTIPLFAEVLAEDARPRAILINTASGSILRVDPATGVPQILISGNTPLTDIARHPTTDQLYGVDGTRIYEIDLASSTVSPIFAHGVPGATALGFSPAGELFLGADDVHRVNLVNRTAQKYADGGSSPAGDLAFVGSRLYLSTTNGDFYEVRSTGPLKLGNLGGLSLVGLVSTDADTLIGFSGNQAYVVNLSTITLTPQFSSFIFSVAGATDLADFVAHNATRPNDVDGDGQVVPLDALLIINELNTHLFTHPTTGKLLSAPIGETRYPDVNDDGFVTAIDALLVINELNSPALPALPATASTTDAASTDEAWAEIGAALELRPRRLDS